MNKTSNKPVKPAPDFPLFAHQNGQWAKKIKGKIHYFGLWDDPQEALEQYLAFVSPSSQKSRKSTLATLESQSIPSGSDLVKEGGKPEKPYPGFPLYPHKRGQWAKKIRGKTYFFGVWEDHHAALTRYLSEKDDLEAGRRPQPRNGDTTDTLTVQQMVFLFLEDKKLRVESGEMEATTWKDYERYGNRMIRVFGANTPVESLIPEDFQRYRADLQKTHKSLESLKGDITKSKTFFNWAGPGVNGQGYLNRLPRFGTSMKVPARVSLLRERQERGMRVLTAEQIRALLAKADAEGKVKLKAMILLGINAGFGNMDCAKLTKGAIDLAAGWVTFPRPKTGVVRRSPLWPETLATLRAVLASRKSPRESGDANRVFVTKYNQAFRPCAIGYEFEKLAGRAGMTREEADYYDLRRTCISIGLQISDDDAMRTISGHQRKAEDMLGVYNRLAVSDARLQEVTDHIHAWLFPKPASKQPESDDGGQPDAPVEPTA